MLLPHALVLLASLFRQSAGLKQNGRPEPPDQALVSAVASPRFGFYRTNSRFYTGR
jgi:hypothetical protein